MPDMTLTSLVMAVASRQSKSLKIASKICYKMVYYILCLGSANRQKLRWKVRIYVGENQNFLKRLFLKEARHLKC